ncbi:MAG: hypothetical protein R3E65_04100 [Steroidobacteraceae bacterium]
MLPFIRDGLGAMLRGSPRYRAWLVLLLALVAVGVYSYALQLRDGLVVTGMSDQVSWGFYIATSRSWSASRRVPCCW